MGRSTYQVDDSSGRGPLSSVVGKNGSNDVEEIHGRGRKLRTGERVGKGLSSGTSTVFLL